MRQKGKGRRAIRLSKRDAPLRPAQSPDQYRQLKKNVSRHCERSEAIQLLWIASGFAFAMTNLYFSLKLTVLGSGLRRIESKAPALRNSETKQQNRRT
jgi:hypothetical protein